MARPLFIALGPANRIAIVDGASHLVTNGVSNDVSVIDVVAQKVIKSIQVGELPWGITIARP